MNDGSKNLLDIHAREKQSLMGHVHSLDVRVGNYESLNPFLEEHDQLNNVAHSPSKEITDKLLVGVIHNEPTLKTLNNPQFKQ